MDIMKSNKIFKPFTYDSTTNQILLSIDDKAFIDYNIPDELDSPLREERKKQFLKSFQSYISNQITFTLQSSFIGQLSKFLNDKNITFANQREFLYLSRDRDNLLFSDKTNSLSKNGQNKILISKGEIFNQDN